MEPLVDYCKKIRVEAKGVVVVAAADDDDAAPSKALIEKLGAEILKSSKADGPISRDYFKGQRRCGICGLYVRTPLCMPQHLSSKQHCNAFAEKYLREHPRCGEEENGLLEKEVDYRSLLIEALDACHPEPPDAAFWALSVKRKRGIMGK